MVSSSQEIEFDVNVDIVMCIDATGSMTGAINMVKDNALNFDRQLKDALKGKSRVIDRLRIKVITFGDLTFGETQRESPWFDLPQDASAFRDFVESIKVRGGGGDGTESPLEAIATAMKQDWVKIGSKRRHIILLWTDEGAKMPGVQKVMPDAPRSLAEFVQQWQDPQMALMNRSAKRMVLFVPDHPSWEFVDSLENVVRETVDVHGGLSDLNMGMVMRYLADSI